MCSASRAVAASDESARTPHAESNANDGAWRVPLTRGTGRDHGREPPSRVNECGARSWNLGSRSTASWRSSSRAQAARASTVTVVATRSGGHFATLHPHIDDFVESLRVLTPRGPVETRRLPGDGAGVAPDRLFIGSEGTLGVITRAWMRLLDRPRFRSAASVAFRSFEDGWQAAREIAQSGLWPANCRLLDHDEALISGAGDGSRTILIVAFESADHPVETRLARAVEISRAHRGEVTGAGTSGAEGPAGTWRRSFVRGGHLHDAYVRLGLVQETFETAITWDRFPDFHAAVRDATSRAVEEQCGQGIVSCRFAYVYPDGPAPYYTVVAPGRRGSELEQWAAIKEAASESILRLGGTITHHHAVGRDHRPWYDRQRPPLFAEALHGVKRVLDPGGVMNPGVLIGP